MRQFISFILILLSVGCTNEKKEIATSNSFLQAEKAFNEHDNYQAIQNYKRCLKNIESLKDSNTFITYCNLAVCYYKINNKDRLNEISKIVDSLYRNLIFLNGFKYQLFLVKALNYQIQKKYKEASEFFQKSLDILPPNDTISCFLLYKLGVCFEKLNNLDKAEKFYKNALRVAKFKKEIFSSELAECYNAMAFLTMVKYSDFLLTKMYYDSVLYVSTHCHHLDSVSYAWNLYNIGYFYYTKRMYNKAEQYYTNSFDLFIKLKNFTSELATLSYYQSYLYMNLKKNEIAQNKSDLAISYFSKNLDPLQLQESYYVKGYINYLIDSFRLALNYYQKALALNEKYCLTGKERILNYFGRCYMQLNETDSAEFYYKSSIAFISKIKTVNINTYVSLNGGYTLMLLIKRKYYEALKNVETSLSYIHNILGEKNSQYGYLLCFKAQALENLNKLNAGLKIYQDVIKSSVDNKINTGIYDAPVINSRDIISYDNLIDAFIGKGDLLTKMANKPETTIKRIFLLEKSLEHYSRAKNFVEMQNRKLNTESDRLQFTGSKSNLNEMELLTSLRLFRLTGQQKYLEKAFLAADHGKAVQLSFGLKDDDYRNIACVPDSITTKEKKLQEDIAFLQSSIREEQSRKRPKEENLYKMRTMLMQYSDESEELSKYTDEKYPKYAQLKYSENEVNLDTLKSITGLDKTIVEYSFAGDSLYTFVLSGNNLHVLSQSAKGIEDSIIVFKNCLCSVNKPDTYRKDGIARYIKKAFYLYIVLIKPIEQYISNKEIIIIPDGMINQLPIESLVTSDTAPVHVDYGLLQYVLYRYIISYSYSAGLYIIQNKMSVTGTNEVLAFAPVYENNLKRLPEKIKKDSISELLSSRDEAMKIVEIFGGKAIIGKKATKSMFKKHAADGKVLHLAMHTYIDNENLLSSKLLFYQNTELAKDRNLNAYEIYNLKLRSPLIVLSACGTGNGKLMKGEGIISLSRSFLYAGCPSLVVTLWNIEDTRSSYLLQFFYQNLKIKESVNKSLQRAKIDYIENSSYRYSHPYYWASFIQTGKTETFLITPKKHYKEISIDISVILIIGITVYFLKKRK